MRRLLLSGIVLAALALAPGRAAADFIATATGINAETGATVSAKAVFSVSGDILTITLKNTTANTINRGDVLTGLLFNVNLTPVPALNLTSTALTAGSLLYTSKTTSTNVANINGGWTDSVAAGDPFGTAATGFNGVFQAGDLSKGNGGTDYGVIGAGTTFQNGFSASTFPLINDSVTFQFSGASGITDSMFTDVQFLFGTSGTGILDGGGNEVLTPAPSGLIFAVFAIGCVGFHRIRRGRVEEPA